MIFKNLTLDRFQEEAVAAIEEKKSVLVSAPTGSGKTLIADYIIDKDIKLDKRIIYTAPIKALSNQKFRDFVQDYGEEKIGLITGDLVINRNAQVLIMTTEIYRNMAIMKDPLLDTVSYCIMDEIHYISDFERGYVWEESIIFSPSHIRFIFLSATIPNSSEFASWVESIKRHPVAVIKHSVRAVPLDKKFYDVELGITTLDKIKGKSALDKFPDYHHSHSRKPWKRQRIPAPDYNSLILDLRERDKLPCIFFLFSRVKTEDFATKLSKRNNFLSDEETKQLTSIFSEELLKVSPEVRGLPSTGTLRECISKGIAFHHAGLLPDVKHIIEKLFSKGLIKVLFATETFAVGVNMPARTVCLGGLRKYTGVGFRYLNSKEYFQLSGRAGRRGIDKEGLSVAMINRISDDLKRIEVFTKADTLPIKSQFRLSPNTILNMVNLHSPDERERILKMNFFTYQKLHGNMKKNVLVQIKARYDSMMKLLGKLGYIDDSGHLTKLGLFTTRIYSDELEISQLFMSDFNYAFDEETMMLVLAALVFEEKKDVEFYNTYPSQKIKQLQSAIKSHQFLRKGKWHERLQDLTALIKPFFERKKFVEMLENSSIPEGDLIRFYMQLLDKLEQIGRAFEDGERRQMARNCKDLIRDSLEGIHVF